MDVKVIDDPSGQEKFTCYAVDMVGDVTPAKAITILTIAAPLRDAGDRARVGALMAEISKIVLAAIDREREAM